MARAERQANIALKSRSRVTQLVDSADHAVATGVRYDEANGRSNDLPADLFVDASSRGSLTLALLDRLGLPRPKETEIGIDLRYATGMFEIPSLAPCDWRAVLHRPSIQSGRGGLLVPVESNRWQVNLTGMHGEPENVADFVSLAGSLRTRTIHDAIEGAIPVDRFTASAFPAAFAGILRRRTAFQTVCCRSAM